MEKRGGEKVLLEKAWWAANKYWILWEGSWLGFMNPVFSGRVEHFNQNRELHGYEAEERGCWLETGQILT